MLNAAMFSSEMQNFLYDICEKMNGIRNQKQEEILKAFTDASNFFPLFEKIKNNEIITRGEHENLKEFNHAVDYTYGIKVPEHEKDRLLVDFSQYIADYPLVVDAWKINEISSLKQLGIVQTEEFPKQESEESITLNGTKGLVQKILNEKKDGYAIHTICGPEYQQIICPESSKKDGIICVKQENKRFFMQLKKDEQGKYHLEKIVMPKYEKFLYHCFDNDDMAFVSNTKGTVFYNDGERGIIKKQIAEDDSVYIQELISPILQITKESKVLYSLFDEYNQIYAKIADIGKVVLRKKYENGKCIWVDVFKKGRGGKETKIDL